MTPAYHVEHIGTDTKDQHDYYVVRIPPDPAQITVIIKGNALDGYTGKITAGGHELMKAKNEIAVFAKPESFWVVLEHAERWLMVFYGNVTFTSGHEALAKGSYSRPEQIRRDGSPEGGNDQPQTQQEKS